MTALDTESADLLESTRRMVDDTRLLIGRLRSDDVPHRVLRALGAAERQLRRSHLCLLHAARVLNANPGLFGICEYREKDLGGDASYRRFREELHAACVRPSDDGR